MGVWGTGIYSSDTAEEVRDTCNEIFPFVSVEEGNRIIFEEFHEVAKSDLIDNDYASFWYALADWQWKHGILSEDIRLKVIQLLEKHTGIEDWEESASKADVRKRLAVMEKLKKQLESLMPAPKIPKKKLAKPKHKVGDIVIFRTCTLAEDPGNNIWNQERVRPPFMFKNPVISSSSDRIDPIYDAHDRYMAVLCVGTDKVEHSEYLENVYDEYSVYAYYDYISLKKPTLEELQMSGFLPQIIWSFKEDYRTTDYMGWTYIFTMSAETFRVTASSCVKEIKKITFS